MKTISYSSTTSSVFVTATSRSDQPQSVATVAPDGQRINSQPQRLGLVPQWVALEPRAFGWIGCLYEDYCSDIRNLYALNNGGAFTVPEPDDDDDEAWAPFSAMNDSRAEMSPEITGIATCLMICSHHACRVKYHAAMVCYYRLQDYALQHPKRSAVMCIID